MDRPPRLKRRPGQASPASSRSSSTHSTAHSLGTVNKDNIKLERWLYDDIPLTSAPFKEGNINNSDIAPWFRAPGPLSSHGRKSPSVGLRLICRQHEISTAKPFDDKIMREIHAAIGIPPTHTYLMTNGAGQCGKYMVGPHQPLFVFHRSNSHSTISAVIKHDFETNITVGYILFGPAVPMEAVKNAITSQFPVFSLPLLIPVVIAEVTAETIMGKLTDIHLKLADIENRTGYSDWGSEPTLGGAELKPKPKPKPEPEPEPKSESEEDISHKDYRKLSSQLGALDSRYAFLDVAVSCTLMTTEFAIQEIKSMKDYVQPAKMRALKGTADNLGSRAEVLASNLKHMQMFGGISQRMQAQQNVIFNLISQQDNFLNVGIANTSKDLAAASKRDSSAMKIIAFLTTLFLPGTFIAAFFAMPLFDWSEKSMSSVMTDHFWMYWAVTLPLTVVVMGFMGVYLYHQHNQRMQDLKDAHKIDTLMEV